MRAVVTSDPSFLPAVRFVLRAQDELTRELEALEQATLDEHILQIEGMAEQPADAISAPAAPTTAAEVRPLPAMPSAPTTKVQETQEVSAHRTVSRPLSCVPSVCARCTSSHAPSCNGCCDRRLRA